VHVSNLDGGIPLDFAEDFGNISVSIPVNENAGLKGVMMFNLLLATTASLALAAPAMAAISLGPTVSGLGTFTDSNTGRNWVRMDTYFNQTYNFMANDLTGKGFTLATRTDIEALFATVDVAADFNGVAAIMGRAPNRALIWGAFAPVETNNTINWAYAFSGGGWAIDPSGFDPNTVPNFNSPDADMNFWAFTGGNAVVPEPASWAMLIAGFGLVGAVARRRRVVAA